MVPAFISYVSYASYGSYTSYFIPSTTCHPIAKPHL